MQHPITAEVNMLELFEEKHWVGEFFVNKNYNNRFMGEIDYSPDNGVVLSYTITGHDVLRWTGLSRPFTINI